jgi:hypothetical protein
LVEDEYGAVYSKDYKILFYYPCDTSFSEYYIHDGCKIIKKDAFECMRSIDNEIGNKIEHCKDVKTKFDETPKNQNNIEWLNL